MRSSSILSLVIASLLSTSQALAADPKPDASLSKIRVTADEEVARSVTGNAKVVTPQQLEAEQAQNMEDAIRYIPGVSMVDMGRFGDNGFNIRGLESDRISITVDGLSFAETVETSVPYEFFRGGRGSVDIDSLKRIEVIKGADSITAGSGALGGAVMFTTKDPYDYLNASGNDTFFRVRTGYTSASEETMASFTAANRIGRLESMLVYTLRRGHETESWHDNTLAETGPDRRIPDPIDRDNDNLLGKVDFVLNDSHRLGVVYERSRTTTDVNNLSRVYGTGYLTRRGDDEQNRDRYGVRWIWSNANTFFDTLEWTADRMETESRGRTNILAGSGCPQGVIPCFRREDRATDQVLDRTALDFSKVFSTGATSHSLVYGAAWQQRDVDFTAIDYRFLGTTSEHASVTVDPKQVPKTDVANWNLYLRDSMFLLNDRLTLHAGLRYDVTEYSPKTSDLFEDNTGSVRDTDFGSLTWQFGADFKFTPNHSVWAQVGRGFRAPSVGELFSPTNTRTVIETATGNTVTVPSSMANADIKSEKSLNTELGYRWQSERLMLGISVFRDKYTDYIETGTFVYNPGTEYSVCSGANCTTRMGVEYSMPANIGEVTVEGVEVEGRWFIDDNWSARLAWSYSEGERRNGDPLQSIVPANGVVGIHYRGSDRFSITGNLTHGAAKKMEDAALSNSGDFFSAGTPDFLSDSYTTVDLFGTLNITKDLELSAGIYNALNEKYMLWPRIRMANRGTNTLYGYVSDYGVDRFTEPGCNFRVSLAWKF